MSHLHEKFEPGLAQLTWASIDHCIHQTLHGNPEALQRWVTDPVSLQLHAKDLPIVMFDQTPVRLKLWSYGKQFITDQDIELEARHRKLARDLKTKPETRDETQRELEAQAAANQTRCLTCASWCPSQVTSTGTPW